MRTLALVLFVALLAVAPCFAAPILLGTINQGSTPSTLVELDPATGALVRTIGPVGYAVNGLAWDPTTGILYAGTAYRDASFNGLIQIDITTGAGTPVGAPDWGGAYGRQAAVALTASPSGELFAWCESCYDGGGGYSDVLTRIDKSTGVSTLFPGPGLGSAVVGLTFDFGGVLIVVNSGGSYYSVNTSTGVTTYLGSIGQTAHHGDLDPTTGLYYGIDANGSGAKNLVVANLSTGTVVGTLPTVSDLHTLAFVNIPEPGAVLLVGLGLIGLGWLKRRRA